MDMDQAGPAPPSIATQEEWLAARMDLLRAEKEHAKAADALSAKRRQLPWVDITERGYKFTEDNGRVTPIQDLFGKHTQLVVQHIMFGKSYKEPCSLCSFYIDQMIGALPHFNRRFAYVGICQAPHDHMKAAFAKKSGWDKVRMLSADGTSFGQDFGVSFANVADKEKRVYNYTSQWLYGDEAPGISVFVKRDGKVYHTYSTYAAGLAPLSLMHHVLDITPEGRAEVDKNNMFWVDHKEQY